MNETDVRWILTWLIWTTARAVGYYWVARGLWRTQTVAWANLKHLYKEVFGLGEFKSED